MTRTKTCFKETPSQWRMASRIGTLYLTASSKGLSGVHWRRQNAPMVPSLNGAGPSAGVLRQAVREISEYLGGTRRTFAVRLDPKGTDFQKKVWRRLRAIPYGQTRSYKEVAATVGNPRAGRAVGTANGQNPICIVVPCHRVIASDGSLSGYSGPAGIKRRLLDLERPRVR